MVIVDTSVWIDYFKDVANWQTEWLESAIGTQEVGLTSLILCEVLQGVRSDAQYNAFRHDLLQMAVFDTGSAELALLAAQNYRKLRKNGLTVRTTIDCIIATFCIEYDFELLHKDSDFEAFKDHLGLRTISSPATTSN
jgi:predicted nucleic acid-binding protein